MSASGGAPKARTRLRTSVTPRLPAPGSAGPEESARAGVEAKDEVETVFTSFVNSSLVVTRPGL
jgi:hypothetical protein